MTSGKLSHIGAVAFFTLVLIAAFQNCGPSKASRIAGATSQSGISADEIADRYKIIQQLGESDLRCVSVVNCETVPLGNKACGGPTAYLITSTLNPQFEKINLLAEELAELERKFNIQNEIISNCSFEMPPELICLNSICKIK